MKITPLPSAETVVEIIGEYQQGRAALHCEMRYRVNQRDDLAYTRLIEGIEGMRKEEYHSCAAPPCLDIAYPCEHILEWEVHNKALNDIIEKVVKPLYGKVE